MKIIAIILSLFATATLATAAPSIILTSSPSEVSRGNPVTFRFASKGLPNLFIESNTCGLLRKDGVNVGWVTAVTVPGENGIVEFVWYFSGYRDDTTKIRVVDAGEGYSLLIGILPTPNQGRDFRLPSTVNEETFFIFAKTPRFSIKPNRSNLFITIDVTSSDVFVYVLGKEGDRYRLEGTTDLRSWSPVLTLPRGNDKGGDEVFINVSDEGLGFYFLGNPIREILDNRFYRVREIPWEP